MCVVAALGRINIFHLRREKNASGVAVLLFCTAVDPEKEDTRPCPTLDWKIPTVFYSS